MHKIDCCGLPCPQPVLATKELIDKFRDEIIEVIVDNEAAKQNVTRFLESQGREVSISEPEEGKYLITSAPGSCAMDFGASNAPENIQQRILIFIPSEVMGYGDDSLGQGLIKTFIGTLKEMGDDLWRIILVNSGVKLSLKTSPAFPGLKELETQGTTILVCGTCLEFFGILEQKAVGETTNMLDIVTSMQHATKVIRI